MITIFFIFLALCVGFILGAAYARVSMLRRDVSISDGEVVGLVMFSEHQLN